MILDQVLSSKIYERASLNRAFEVSAFEQMKLGNIKFPAYLSAGQEYISATLAVALEEAGLSVRPFPGEGLRISIAEREANDRFIEVALQVAGGFGARH